MKVSPLPGKPASSAMFVTVVKLVRLSIWSAALFIAGLLAILISLFSRWTSVGGAVLLMRRFRSFSAGAIKILTWGGLRGGISVALALSIYGRGLLHRHPGDDSGEAGCKNLA